MDMALTIVCVVIVIALLFAAWATIKTLLKRTTNIIDAGGMALESLAVTNAAKLEVDAAHARASLAKEITTMENFMTNEQLMAILNGKRSA